MPRYDIRNPVHLTELLNQRLAAIVARHANAFLLDFDQLCAMFGRKYSQDDATSLFVHGALMTNYDFNHDQNRLEPVVPILQQYGSRTEELLRAVWEESCAMFRTLRQLDSVKLVIVDLDDTLWRGVIAEDAAITSHTTEGWPLGFVESLLYLKRRGILLAIVSKNEQARVEQLWGSLYGGRLELSDFASVRINWQPKVENVAQVLSDMNLLPRSVVFVDDNPVERAAVSSAFPELRVLGSNPYQLRRIMLWAPELQTTGITSESLRRTEMIQSQAHRETARQAMTREDFLVSVAPKVVLFNITGSADPRFARAFELLNKTNQFNTTGRRWSAFELQAAVDQGISLFAFEVQDRYTRYGLVGLIIVQGSEIMQFVMSCRVLGLEIELAVLAAVADLLQRPVTASITETDANMPVRDLYKRASFRQAAGHFSLSGEAEIPATPHIDLMLTIGDATSFPHDGPTPPVSAALVPQSDDPPPTPTPSFTIPHKASIAG